MPPTKVAKKLYMCNPKPVIIYVVSPQGKAVAYGLRAQGSIA